MDWITRTLEKRGAKEMTKNDRRNTLILGILFELITIAIILLSVKFLLLKLIISVYILITLGITYYIIEKDFNPPEFILIIIATLPLFYFILAIYIMLSITPYRGNDPMKLRKEKLRILIRKSKYNKLKFWKN